MNWVEYDKCIKHINPAALFTIDGDLNVTWDLYHVGEKPSWEDCFLVLPIIQAEEAVEAEKQRKKEIYKQLDELDKQSIRSMREWLSQVEDPPSFIVAYDTMAANLRSQL